MKRALLLLVPTAFLLLFLFFPLVSILDLGLRPEGRLDLSGFARVLLDSDLRHVIWFTFAQAAASTALTLLLGIPAAYVLARFRFRGRGAVRGLTIAPFALPTVVVGTSFLALLGDGSLGALLAAHVFFNISVVILIVGGAILHLDPGLEDAAAVLGAGRLRSLLLVTVPAVRSSILTAATIVFLFTFTSFGVVLLLGGPGRATIEVEIWRQTSQLLNLPVAAVLALVQLLAVAVVLWIAAWAEVRAPRRRTVAADRAERPPYHNGERIALVLTLVILGLLILTPLLALAGQAVWGPAGPTLDRFVRLGSFRAGGVLAVPPLNAIANSLIFAVAATTIALALGGATSAALASSGTASGAKTFFSLPLGVSAVILGFGMIVAFDAPPLDLRGSVPLLVAAQALVALPFVVRILTPALREADRGPREAALVLGATPWKVQLEIVLPIMWRSVLTAAVLAFAVSLGEFGATVFLVRADLPTMPVMIARLLGQPGSTSIAHAAAMATILALVTVGAGALIERLRPFGTGRL